MHKLLYTALLCFFAGNLSAQSYLDLFSFRYQQSPNNAYKQGSGEVDIQEVNLSFSLPIQFENKDALIIGGSYNNLSLSQEFTPEIFVPILPARFQSISLQLGYVKQLREDLNMLVMVIPKLSSDFKEISGKDFQLGGLVLFTKTKNEHFKWKYGLYYNQEFFSPFIVGFLGWDWKINDKWRFWALLPQGATLDRKLNDRFHAGFTYSTPVSSYRLSESPVNAPYQNGYLHQTYFGRLDLYGEVYLSKNVALQARAGHTLFRNFRVFGEEDTQGANIWGIGFQDRSEFLPNQYSALKDGFVFELGLYFRYHLEDK